MFYFNIFRLRNELEIIKKKNEELVKTNGDLRKLVIEQNKWINLEACRFENKFKNHLSNIFSPQQT